MFESEESRYKLDLWDVLTFVVGAATSITLGAAISLDVPLVGILSVGIGVLSLRVRRALAPETRRAALHYDHLPKVGRRAIVTSVFIGVGLVLALVGLAVGIFFGAAMLTVPHPLDAPGWVFVVLFVSLALMAVGVGLVVVAIRARRRMDVPR
jgi:hypothetical protein